MLEDSPLPIPQENKIRAAATAQNALLIIRI